MKCPKCLEDGLKSKVYTHGGTSTCMMGETYYDEEGKYHDHDPNIHCMKYHCSNGHDFVVSVVYGCKACGTEDEVTEDQP